MSNFEDIMMELELATEGVNATLTKDFASTAKAAAGCIMAAKKAKKAGNYDEAVKKCDEGIGYINAFKAAAKEATANGEGAVLSQVVAAAARIAGAVLALAVGAAAARGAKKVGTTVSDKVGAAAKDAKYLKEEWEQHPTISTGSPEFKEYQKAKKKSDILNPKAPKAPAALAKAAGAVKGGVGKVADTKVAKAAGEHKKGLAVGGATVAALAKSVKEAKAGNNAAADSYIKMLDMAVKVLESVKASCNDMRREDRDARESAMIDAFFDGVLESVFGNDDMTVLECLIELGMDDIEACESFVNDVYPYVMAIESTIDEFEEDVEVEDPEV